MPKKNRKYGAPATAGQVVHTDWLSISKVPPSKEKALIAAVQQVNHVTSVEIDSQRRLRATGNVGNLTDNSLKFAIDRLQSNVIEVIGTYRKVPSRR